MDWYRQIQFVAAVAMADDIATAYGTTVNGMWADPEGLSSADVAYAHAQGRRVLFSVPMIALTPVVYEAPDTRHLVEEVCLDVEGQPSECDWYYWESKPVFAGCIYSDTFRGYLMERCRDGVDKGMDVVNLDEIMTGIGLMDLDRGGCGFCRRCLDRFRAHAEATDDPRVTQLDDDALRAAIRADDDLYRSYRRFHEQAAFDVMIAFIDELRAYADRHHPAFAISANVGYLGDLVRTFGPLWGCGWGRHVDFVLFENHYRVEAGGPHELLPRGSFAASYRLGSALTDAPAWICPSITVPRQLAGQPRATYYLLMFLEAYANGGRWGYYWWPGVDAATRLAATAPEALKTWIRFIDEHRDLYEGTTSRNAMAILYADGPILRRPEAHAKYLALAQALAERSVQFDVVFGGDGRFNPDELDPDTLARYRTILIPEARDMGPPPVAALEGFARAGGNVVTFSESPLAHGLAVRADGEALTRFWHDYLDADRDLIVDAFAGLPAERIEVSDPSVRVTHTRAGRRHVLHVLALGYDEATDSVPPSWTSSWAFRGRRATPGSRSSPLGESASWRRRSRATGCASRCPRSTHTRCSWRPARSRSVEPSRVDHDGLEPIGDRAAGDPQERRLQLRHAVEPGRDRCGGGIGGPPLRLDHERQQAHVASRGDPGRRGPSKRERDGRVDDDLLVERLVPRRVPWNLADPPEVARDRLDVHQPGVLGPDLVLKRLQVPAEPGLPQQAVVARR